MPPDASSIQSLTISPSKDVLAKRLPLRVTFVKADLTEVFSLIEFRFIKLGTEQFQIESCYPPLPFRLTITLPWQKGPGRLDVTFQYDGHDIRRVYQTHRALRALFSGGCVELTNLEDDRHLGTLRDLSPKGMIESPELDNFISDLYEIAETLKVPIRYSRPTRQDAENLEAIRQVLRTGELLISAESVNVNLTRDQVGIAQDALAAGNGLHLPFEKPPDFALVFGQSLDRGPYSVFLNVSELGLQASSPQDGTLPVKLTLKGPALYRFPRFLGDDNQTPGLAPAKGVAEVR
jgi:hypothetical protein